ncbi:MULTISPECIES: magnesium transporter CorA family protein [Bacillus]|uniref:Magnesium transporter n=2 Tax=Bacillus TaxID=1386 RepID=A0A0M5JJR4_9BACI|nr:MULTISPECIES: magnesium transporter CorA family protein [Bacillus]ALC83757.1 magnesium transporter [Bacillus gobiensis]MBP1083976.1 Mg2+ and Co2+ transporter CorA [Bacillus capparidis]MED1096978.1 magnesium transporter CorA family protein [Bacillus capparidis]
MEIHRGEDWVWYQLINETEEEGKKLTEQFQMPQFLHWYETIDPNKRNTLHIDTALRNKEAVYGSFHYTQDLHEEADHSVFHFYVTRDHLFTVDLDMSILKGIDQKQVNDQAKNAPDSIEGFLVILGEMLKGYLEGIDILEMRLQNLKWQIYADNNKSIVDQVLVLRHEILIWKGLIMSIKKILMAVEETFLIDSPQKEAFLRTSKRVDRGFIFASEFEEELSYLMHSEEVITSHRGNEIVKSLTIFTVLFTPMTALGALWGMNFEFMPELSFKYGYLFAIVLILLSTLLIYLYLVKKGWTGDILKDKKKKILRKRRSD